MTVMAQIPYRPRPLQGQFHEAARRFSVAVCHRRFGKTVMAVNQLLQCVLNADRDRSQGAYIAPTFSQVKKIAWDYCKQFTRHLSDVRFGETELRIDLPGDRRVWLFGAEKPDRLRGLYFDYVVLDEYADINPRLYPEVIRPALSERQGGALWIGTPRGHDHFWTIFETARSAALKGNPEWHFCQFKASQTGVLPEAELRLAALDMSSEQYEQEFECSFTAAITGAYYGRLLAQAEREGRIGTVPWEPQLPVHTAWDLGVSDSTAIWFFQIDQSGRRYIDFYEASGEGLLHYANVLLNKPYRYGDHFQPHDVRVREIGSGKSRVEVLRDLGIRSEIVPQLSVQDGIEAARLVLRSCRFDAVKCRQGLDALRQYRRQYDDARRDFRDRPLHDWTSHAADAFRMSAIGRERRQRGNLRNIAITGQLASGQQAVVSDYAVLD